MECLRQLFSCIHDDVKITVFLVDDGCTDGTTEAVKEAFDDVRVICGDGKLYWNRGMIAAWKEALTVATDFYLWLNDDTMLYKTALATLTSSYGRCGKSSIIVGSICSADKKNATYGGYLRGQRVVPNGTEQEVDRMNGNAVLLPQSVFCKIGMLDPVFRHSYGDWEYGYRARRCGIKLFLTPTYVGECDRHDYLEKCFDPCTPLNERWRYLLSPLGHHPMEVLHYGLKTEGWLAAAKSMAAVVIRTLMPQLFKKCRHT